MNRLRVFAFLLTGALAGPAAAELHIHKADTTDPVTGLGPAEWEAVVGGILHPEALVGDPGVMVVSSVSVPLTVTCDRWTLVGPSVYSSVKGNPTELKPFSVTYIKTRDFDGYCRTGLVGHSGIGRNYTGHLSVPDSFTDSTTVLFSGTGE